MWSPYQKPVLKTQLNFTAVTQCILITSQQELMVPNVPAVSWSYYSTWHLNFLPLLKVNLVCPRVNLNWQKMLYSFKSAVTRHGMSIGFTSLDTNTYTSVNTSTMYMLDLITCINTWFDYVYKYLILLHVWILDFGMTLNTNMITFSDTLSANIGAGILIYDDGNIKSRLLNSIYLSELGNYWIRCILFFTITVMIFK